MDNERVAQALTNREIEEIREAHARAERSGCTLSALWGDIGVLLDEIDRLRSDTKSGTVHLCNSVLVRLNALECAIQSRDIRHALEVLSRVTAEVCAVQDRTARGR